MVGLALAPPPAWVNLPTANSLEWPGDVVAEGGHDKDHQARQASDGEAQERAGGQAQHGQEDQLDPDDDKGADEIGHERAGLIKDLQAVAGFKIDAGGHEVEDAHVEIALVVDPLGGDLDDVVLVGRQAFDHGPAIVGAAMAGR